MKTVTYAFAALIGSTLGLELNTRGTAEIRNRSNSSLMAQNRPVDGLETEDFSIEETSENGVIGAQVNSSSTLTAQYFGNNVTPQEAEWAVNFGREDFLNLDFDYHFNRWWESTDQGWRNNLPTGKKPHSNSKEVWRN